MLRPRDRALLFAVSLFAGAIHLWVMPEHFEVWWGYGTFFGLAGAAQIFYGAVWLVAPLGFSAARSLAVSGVAFQVGLIGLYVVSRSIGIPLLGPEAGHVEPVEPLGLVAKTLEVALVLFLVALLPRIDNRMGPAIRA